MIFCHAHIKLSSRLFLYISDLFNNDPETGDCMVSQQSVDDILEGENETLRKNFNRFKSSFLQ
ncbi:hypothetical protein HZS_5730 [Henneguya salminicola]|nr:hypothetical protein HZS_5730 [Henneguya salminicola]